MISKNKIKYIRSLELKKNRNKEGKFVAEGFKVVDDLLALQPADLIVATGEWLRGKHFGAETEVIEVTDEELKKVSFLQHPQHAAMAAWKVNSPGSPPAAGNPASSPAAGCLSGRHGRRLSQRPVPCRPAGIAVHSVAGFAAFGLRGRRGRAAVFFTGVTSAAPAGR